MSKQTSMGFCFGVALTLASRFLPPWLSFFLFALIFTVMLGLAVCQVHEGWEPPRNLFDVPYTRIEGKISRLLDRAAVHEHLHDLDGRFPPGAGAEQVTRRVEVNAPALRARLDSPREDEVPF